MSVSREPRINVPRDSRIARSTDVGVGEVQEQGDQIAKPSWKAGTSTLVGSMNEYRRPSRSACVVSWAMTSWLRAVEIRPPWTVNPAARRPALK
jgi:hypothetical protein